MSTADLVNGRRWARIMTMFDGCSLGRLSAECSDSVGVDDKGDMGIRKGMSG